MGSSLAWRTNPLPIQHVYQSLLWLRLMALITLVLWVAWVARVDARQDQKPLKNGISVGWPSTRKTVTLKHVFHHGAREYPDIHRRFDVPSGKHASSAESNNEFEQTGPFSFRTQSGPIQRLADRSPETIQDLLAEARFFGVPPVLPPKSWTTDEVPFPDVTDKDTVVSLAVMAANAYRPDACDPNWTDIGRECNASTSFGWEDDGLRGHVFADDTNSTIVIATKGTSVGYFFDSKGTLNDKENDNLFGSCCCAQGGSWFWHQVCDCKPATYTCDNTCVSHALRQPNRYYQASLELYGNITELYPDADVILTGHSLGGVVTSLLGLTFGVPAVTFEAYGQAKAAERLGLPIAPEVMSGKARLRKDDGGFHFGHTADPIYMGTCNGAWSLCSLGGFAFETQCFTGKRCVYDVVNDRNWRLSLSYHRIVDCIKNIYRQYDNPPPCEADTECQDCVLWDFYDSRETTTISLPVSTTVGRTSTCETPGWFGCLDSTTTTPAMSLTSTPMRVTTTESSLALSSTTSTSICKTPGIFWGCWDTTTTSTLATSALPSVTVITTTSLATTTSPAIPTSTTVTSTCKTPGLFWGCWDEPSTAVARAAAAVVAPTTTAATEL